MTDKNESTLFEKIAEEIGTTSDALADASYHGH